MIFVVAAAVLALWKLIQIFFPHFLSFFRAAPSSRPFDPDSVFCTRIVIESRTRRMASLLVFHTSWAYCKVALLKFKTQG